MPMTRPRETRDAMRMSMFDLLYALRREAAVGAQGDRVWLRAEMPMRYGFDFRALLPLRASKEKFITKTRSPRRNEGIAPLAQRQNSSWPTCLRGQTLLLSQV